MVDKNGDGHISEDEFIDLLITKISNFTSSNHKPNNIAQTDIENAKISKRAQVQKHMKI